MYKYLLMLSLMLAGCSDDNMQESLSKNGDLAESCNCLAKKYNLDMGLTLHADWQTSICRVTHKTEKSWDVKLSLEELNGLKKQRELDELTLAPAIEACLRKELPGYPIKRPHVTMLEAAGIKCSFKVYKKKSMFKMGKCWGLE